MKTLFSLMLFTFVCYPAFAAFAPPAIPVGLWVFQNNYQVTNLRMAEVVSSPGNKPSARVVELRKDGFLCIHQNPVKYLCTKNKANASLSPEQENFVTERFAGSRLEFLPTENQPELIFDGFQQTDYFMSQNLKFGEAKFSQYGITVSANGTTHFKIIAEDDESPNLIATYQNFSFYIPVILQSQVGSQTWGYSLDIILQLTVQYDDSTADLLLFY